MLHRNLPVLFAMALLACLGTAPAVAEMPRAPLRHALAMHGEPAGPPDLAHRRYVNPDAPKGGRIVLGVQGTFDTLNPFVVRGLPVPGARQYLWETLLARSYDEPFTLYPQIAAALELPEDRSWIIFHVDPRARFSDGRPVTAADVRFSFELLKERGRPNHRSYYAKVKSVALLDERTIRFDLAGANDRELPLILGLMPILPAHATDPATFEETTLEPPVGSGPYVIGEVRAGESLSLRRDPNWWGRDLPINRGLFNFDEIRFDFYRDGNTLFEAFKKGLVDSRVETDPGRWASGYDFPAMREGRIVRATLRPGTPKGIRGLTMNTRRPPFEDVRVREALGLLFDFEWTNRALYAGGFERTQSLFEGSELSARGRSAAEDERRLLAATGASVRTDILDGTYQVPVSDGSGSDRSRLRQAIALFAAAGWRLENGAMRHAASGKPFTFEFLVATRDQERLALTYQRFLQRAGIRMAVRNVDAVQYDRRLRDYDFDMVDYRWWNTSLSPGNEQAFYWGVAAGRSPGSRNLPGIADPAVDRLVEAIVEARRREDLVTAARALDRVITSGFYWVPLFHQPSQWIARWNHIGMPAESSVFGYLVETWWRRDAGGADEQ
ncbi:extracellular solute-binding protein [Phreatobacter cathodiphilus]|uniref:ABC transporter substrate-binding protein n=1 Tax=Phreatobacter cathodiphilus TaxID=1868589 RepID=A0A2S0NAK4_9HYPH|nr:extracellular solute-binding protein [Phreatobacter cathodiphilus]AVO44963.1 ABC transporter substrate-binding protein [Phreatobacter cathodiphilus]